MRRAPAAEFVWTSVRRVLSSLWSRGNSFPTRNDRPPLPTGPVRWRRPQARRSSPPGLGCWRKPLGHWPGQWAGGWHSVLRQRGRLLRTANWQLKEEAGDSADGGPVTAGEAARPGGHGDQHRAWAVVESGSERGNPLAGVVEGGEKDGSRPWRRKWPWRWNRSRWRSRTGPNGWAQGRGTRGRLRLPQLRASGATRGWPAVLS